MRSPWDSEYRTRQEYDDHRSSERSTSAPPPQTPLDFGRGDAAARGNNNVSKESIIRGFVLMEPPFSYSVSFW